MATTTTGSQKGGAEHDQVASMFSLALIDDTIKIEASQLGLDTVTALTFNINAKYSNRILPNVGLCIGHFDYSTISEGRLTNRDGCTYYKITFRLIVFRPFVGEVLVGKVSSCDEEGIRITMGFFEDVHISRDQLPSPSGYDHSQAQWFRLFFPENDLLWEDPLLSAEEERWHLQKGDIVRFKVEGDEFNEPEPPGPNTWGKKSLSASNQEEIAAVGSTTAVPPYKVKVS